MLYYVILHYFFLFFKYWLALFYRWKPLLIYKKLSHTLSVKLILIVNPNRMTSAKNLARYVLGNQLDNGFGGLSGRGC